MQAPLTTRHGVRARSLALGARITELTNTFESRTAQLPHSLRALDKILLKVADACKTADQGIVHHVDRLDDALGEQADAAKQAHLLVGVAEEAVHFGRGLEHRVHLWKAGDLLAL